MRRSVQRTAGAVSLIAVLHGAALAGPLDKDGSTHDRNGTPVASSPWLDRAPSKVLSVEATDAKPDRRLPALLTLGGIYAGFSTWAYFAWYKKEGHAFQTGGDGTWKLWSEDSWFGANRYSAGADKMGHAWATYALGRAGTELLSQWGGFGRLTSALVGNGLSELLFFGVELKDGFLYTFSYGDFTFNTLGAALGFAQSMWPRLDETLDFRVQYFPSARYREKFVDGDVNVAEDYSGQTYLLAFHLGSIDRLRTWKYGGWSRFLDISLGFETRGYKPDPPYVIDPEDPTRQDYPKHQSAYIGLSFNAQGLFDALLSGRSEGWRKVTHGAFEVFSLPYSTLPLVENREVPMGFVPDEQEM